MLSWKICSSSSGESGDSCSDARFGSGSKSDLVSIFGNGAGEVEAVGMRR